MLNATDKYLRKFGKVKRTKIVSARRTEGDYEFSIHLSVEGIGADCAQMHFHSILVHRGTV